MKWTPICFLFLVFLGCKTKPSAPDVSKIPVKLNVLRFEEAFFGLDTNHLEESLNEIDRKYPGFAKDFLFNIMKLRIELVVLEFLCVNLYLSSHVAIVGEPADIGLYSALLLIFEMLDELQ